MSIDEAFKEKVRRIVALMEGTENEGEAQAAALALQRLLKKEGATLAEIQVEEETEEEVVKQFTSSQAPAAWRDDLARVVADNHRCIACYMTIDRRTVAIFVGLASDAYLAGRCYEASCKAAENCYNAYSARMREEKERARRGAAKRASSQPELPLFDEDAGRDDEWARFRPGSQAKAAFCQGFVAGLRRCYDEARAADGELALAVSTPRRVVEFFEGMHTVKGRHKGGARGSSSSREAGETAGYGYGRGDRIGASCS